MCQLRFLGPLILLMEFFCPFLVYTALSFIFSGDDRSWFRTRVNSKNKRITRDRESNLRYIIRKLAGVEDKVRHVTTWFSAFLHVYRQQQASPVNAARLVSSPFSHSNHDRWVETEGRSS